MSSSIARQSLTKSLPGLRRILRRFRPYLRPQRTLIVISMASLLAGTMLRLLEPWPLKFVFDRLIRGHSRHGRFATLDRLSDLGPELLLAVSVGALALFPALRAFADYINTVGFAKIGNRVLLRVRGELFEHLQHLSLSFHSSARTGDLTIRVIGDVNMLRDAVVTAVLPLLANILVLIGMWSMMLWMQWRLTLIGLAALPVLWLWTNYIGRQIKDAARKQRQRESAMASTAAESFSAIRIVQALGLEGVFGSAFMERSQQGQKQDVKTARVSARLARVVDVLLAVVSAAVIWQGVRLVRDGAISPGDLLVFLMYLRRAFNPVQDLAKYAGRLAKATAAGERVVDLLEKQSEIRDLPDARPAPLLRGHVEFRGVSFAYEPGHLVLDQFDLDVQPGEHVALVGPSGVGKSTIISLLLRLYDPTAGRVFIDGMDIRQYTLESLRRQISMVMQETILFAASVRENIAYGCPDATPMAIETAALLASAHEFILALPQGYETILGERGITLSGGQRQRVALARAAIRRSPILLLDEPTTGLDEENQQAVTEALHRLSGGRTTFLITHDLDSAARADRILFLEQGRVAESGKHDDLMRLGGRYAALYRLRAASRREREPSHVVAM